MFYLVLVLWLVADLVTKWLVSSLMTVGQSIPLIPHVLSITYILNYGAAFGLLSYQRPLLLGIVCGLALVIAYYYKAIMHGSWWIKYGTALVFSGALGNGWDRLFHRAVVDFIEVPYWPVFNLADIGICLGVVMVMIGFWRLDDKKDEEEDA